MEGWVKTIFFSYFYKWPCSHPVCSEQHLAEVWMVQDGDVATLMNYMKIYMKNYMKN